MPEPPGNLWDLLDGRQREALRARAEVRRFPAGTVLIREGDHAGWVLVLTAGRVKVVSSTPGGHDALLAVRGPGDIIGEMAAMDGKPRSASAIAVEPVTALWLGADAFARILRDHPGIAACTNGITASIPPDPITTTKTQQLNTRRARPACLTTPPPPGVVGL